MPLVKRYPAHVGAYVPPALVERLNRVAPVEEGKRSAFIRRAVETAIEQAEREQAATTTAP